MKFKFVKYSLIALLLLFPSFAAGAETGSLILDDALSLALDNNRTIEAAREQVKQARAKINQTKASAYPELKAKADYTRMEEKEFVNSIGQSFPETKENNYRLGLTLKQKLYAPEVFEAIKASKTYAGQAAVEFEIVKADVVKEVKKVWYRTLFTREMIQVGEESLRQLGRHVEDVKLRFDVGLATDFDLLRAEVQRANAVPSLTKDKNAYNMAENDLRSILGMERAEALLFEGELKYIPFEIPLEEAIERALSTRGEVQFNTLNIRNLEHLVAVSRKESYPSLSLTGNYDYANDGFDASGNEEWEGTWRLGLNLEMTLFDGWWNRSRIAGQQSEVSRSRIQKRDQLSAIDIEVRTAHGNLAEARELIRSQEKNVKNAERAFEIAEAGNLSGVVTELELLDSQLALTEAKSNQTRAVYDWLIARTELEWAMGAMLEGEDS